MATDVPLTALRADAERRVPDLPPIDDVIEDAGRQRMAAYYLYSALLAGVIGDADLASSRWPPELAEPMQRLGLARLAPRTARGLAAQLTQAEQATLHTEARASEFAGFLVDLINTGALGPLCGDADSVRLGGSAEDSGQVLELIKYGRVVGSCAVQAHWELIAQHLAGAPFGTTADPRARRGSGQAASWLRRAGLGHAVGAATVLAVHIHPLGAAAGLGTRLVQARLRAGRDQADALGSIERELSALRVDTASAITDLRAPPRT
jgi:hypothetical protein